MDTGSEDKNGWAERRSRYGTLGYRKGIRREISSIDMQIRLLNQEKARIDSVISVLDTMRALKVAQLPSSEID
jgi:hypothetical protein